MFWKIVKFHDISKYLFLIEILKLLGTLGEIFGQNWIPSFNLALFIIFKSINKSK